MSEDVIKTAIRVGPIPQLEGKSFHYVYEVLKELIGEPLDKDGYPNPDNEEEDIIDWAQWRYHDVFSNGDDWYVDCLTEKTAPPYEHKGLRADIQQLEDLAYPLLEEFELSFYDCQVVAYSWYNGTDEPNFGD